MMVKGERTPTRFSRSLPVHSPMMACSCAMRTRDGPLLVTSRRHGNQACGLCPCRCWLSSSSPASKFDYDSCFDQSSQSTKELTASNETSLPLKSSEHPRLPMFLIGPLRCFKLFSFHECSSLGTTDLCDFHV